VTPVVVLCVALGAAVGAPLRFAVERLLVGSYPWGTWIVNVVGSAVLGALVGHLATTGGQDSAPALLALVGTGFCGSLTTFGGFAAQALDLALAPAGTGRAQRSWRAAGYGLISVLGCVAVAAAAYEIAVSLGTG
jgi:CrcB protein